MANEEVNVHMHIHAAHIPTLAQIICLRMIIRACTHTRTSYHLLQYWRFLPSFLFFLVLSPFLSPFLSYHLFFPFPSFSLVISRPCLHLRLPSLLPYLQFRYIYVHSCILFVNYILLPCTCRWSIEVTNQLFFKL